MRVRHVAVAVLLLAGLGLPVLATDLPAVVAKVGDKNITREEVLEQASAQLAKVRQQEYDVVKAVLDDMIDRKLLEAAAAKEGKTADQWRDAQLDKKVTPPTDAEIEAAYNQFKPRLGGQTLEQAKPQLSTMLMEQQKRKAAGDLMTELRNKSSVSILLEPPRTPVAEAGNPSKGPSSAPVTIIEFSDYQCPFCSRAEGTVKQVTDVYGDKVRVVFRDFPLSFHPKAQKAAEAAGCAMEQGKFWEMHEKMFTNQQALDVDKLYGYAKDLGLNEQKFKDCLDSGKRADEIKQDQKDGSMAGVTGTPAFFVNGRMVVGAQPFENFAKVIDDELTRKGIQIPPKPATPAPAASSPPPTVAPKPAAPKTPETPKAPEVQKKK